MKKTGAIFSLQVGAVCMVAAALFFSTALDATAQPGGRGGPPMAPEKLDAALTLEARGVAKELGLSDEVTAKVVDAYKAARKSQQAAMRELFSAGRGGGMEAFQERLALNEKERGKLEEALKGFLKAEQAGKAVASLGTFNRQWDRFTDTLAGFQLGEEKLYPALKLTCQYVVDSDAARSEAMANMDFQSMRSTAQKLKAKLDAGLAEILSEEQLSAWKTATVRRGRPGGGSRGPRGGGPGGGGPGGGGPGPN